MSRQIDFLAREAIRDRLSRFIEARTEQVQGRVPDPNHETSNLSAPIRVWLAP